MSLRLPHLGRFAPLFLLLLPFTVAHAANNYHDYHYSSDVASWGACVSAHGPNCTGTWSQDYYVWWTGNEVYRYWPGNGGGNACTTRPYSYDSSASGRYAGQCSDEPLTQSNCTLAGGLVSDGNGNCIARPSCPAGQVYYQGSCQSNPCGDLGTVWSETSGSCVYPEEPPENCGIGYVPVVDGSGNTLSCAPALNNNESCDYSKGYGPDGYFLCSDAKKDCSSQGGTHGYIDGSEVCIPSDYSPPTCDSSKAVVLSEGGFVCSSVSDVKPSEDGDINDAPKEPKSGRCDPKTSDCDGDGQIDDPTGSGRNTNGTDPTTGTREASKTGEAASSGSCNAAPVCSGGDPQMCALLRQSWEAMCRGSDIIEEADDSQADVLTGKVGEAVEGAGEDADARAEGVGDDLGSAGEGPLHNETVSLWQGFVDSFVPAGSCSTMSIDTPIQGAKFTINCDNTALIRSFLGWAFYILTAWYIFQLVFKPAEAS